MKFKRSKKSAKGRIEIIPMIDVMFFLLATFILASLAMQNINSLPVNLTKGLAEAAAIENEITLTIDKNGEISLNLEKIKLEEIAKKLSPMLSEKNDKVIIAADENAAHGIVSKAMIESRKAGAKHFSIITQK
jgi:biopolymer transport protein ExbD